MGESEKGEFEGEEERAVKGEQCSVARRRNMCVRHIISAGPAMVAAVEVT